MRNTFESGVKAVSSIVPQAAVAGAVTGTAVDTIGFGDAMAVISIGATTGTPTSFTVNAKVQESADGSTGWTDKTGAAIVAGTVASKVAQIPISIAKSAASKRYVRLVITPAFVAGTSPAIGISGNIMLGNFATGNVGNSTTPH